MIRAALLFAAVATFVTTPLRPSPFNCPHSDLDPIWGDEINAVGGYRLQCRDCRLFIRGPVALATLRATERELL